MLNRLRLESGRGGSSAPPTTASGSLATFTSRTILPASSTMQMLVSLTEMSSPANCEAIFVAMHATEKVRPAIVSPRGLALGYPMFAQVKFESALVGLVCIAIGCMNGRASAVTAEVARKCAALTAKAFPPQVPGNSAAGVAKGTAQFKRGYFNKC